MQVNYDDWSSMVNIRPHLLNAFLCPQSRAGQQADIIQTPEWGGSGEEGQDEGELVG